MGRKWDYDKLKSMTPKILKIKRTYDKNSYTLHDGVVLVIETDKSIIEHQISGTEWSTRFAENSFDILHAQLTKEQIEEVNKLLSRENNKSGSLEN